MSQEPTAPHPSLNAMLICDQSIREEKTANISLIRVFNQITAPSFPAQHYRLDVYVKVTDAQGTYRLRLDLVRIEDLVAVGHGEAVVTVEDRLVPAEWIFTLQFLKFDRPGEYEFRLTANGRDLGATGFRVLDSKQEHGGTNE